MTSFADVLKVSTIIVGFMTAQARAGEVCPAASASLQSSPAISYTESVLSRIGTQAKYPMSAVSMDREGMVSLAVSIDPSGNLADVSVLHSSGMRVLDNAAIAAVKSAAPYPAPLSEGAVVNADFCFEL